MSKYKKKIEAPIRVGIIQEVAGNPNTPTPEQIEQFESDPVGSYNTLFRTNIQEPADNVLNSIKVKLAHLKTLVSILMLFFIIGSTYCTD